MKMLKRNKPETFLDLAKLKIRAKALDIEIKALQKKLLISTDQKKIITELGTFTTQKKETWKTLNMPFIFECMQVDTFLANCSISKTGIVKGIGEKGLLYFVKQRAITLDMITHYFRFTAKK